MTSRPIRFFHRGAIVEVDDARPTRTVLEWLREDARCTGTKEGCNEGDCGACTTVIGELAAPGDADAVRGLRLRTVNACIQFLPTLDGKALFTVEDLKAIQAGGAPPSAASAMPRSAALDIDAAAPAMPSLAASVAASTAASAVAPAAATASHSHAAAATAAFDDLHPVQRAMVECHGSQCGFCTPGFVMSMWSAYERSNACGMRPTRQQMADELSGNLCRCTGYRPILDAGERMFELPRAALDTAPVIAALKTLQTDPPLAYAVDGMRLDAPRTLDALAAARAERPQATLLSGSTDIGLWVTKMFRALPDLIYVGEVAELKRIERRADALRIGAGASLEDAFRALVREWPTLEEVWLRFASVPIRNAGTMGGNVANGSPIGDSAPVLMALDAAIELRRGAAVRSMALADFYVDYMKNRLEPGEFVQAVTVPLNRDAQVRTYKMSKRFDCDISAVCAGLAIELDGDTVKAARLAFGGMAATVKRAARAEAAVVGRPWNEATSKAAQQALADDYKPLTDMRASAGYRLQVAQNLLRRFWLETRTADPLPADRLSVWSTMAHDALREAPARAAAVLEGGAR
jgi:xanthine dehydrogenase small subunit